MGDVIFQRLDAGAWFLYKASAEEFSKRAKKKKALRFMNVCNSPRMLIKPSERFDMFIDVGQMPLMILMSMSNDVFPRVNEVRYKIVYKIAI